ncbi:MAG TPA: hypothetical protein VEA39_07380 [Methylophilaceae bacterium]|nr:hypothetical protein [Methylophilaceae bacterium]
MNISGSDNSKLSILAECEHEYKLASELAEKLGITPQSINYHVQELGPYLLNDGKRPRRYKRNPLKTYVPKQVSNTHQEWQERKEAEEAPSAPILKPTFLAFLMDEERYKPPKARVVEEKNVSWPLRRAATVIGSGSCAHLEIA